METVQKIKSLFEIIYQSIQNTNLLNVSSFVLCLAFTDVVCRYSFYYLGWFSYIVRFVAVVFTICIPLLTTYQFKAATRLVSGIGLIGLAWYFVSEFKKIDDDHENFPLTVFFIHAHIQFCLGILICYVMTVNSAFRFAMYIYQFILAGTILRVTPPGTVNIIFIVTIFLLVLGFLYVLDNGIPISENEINNMFYDPEIDNALEQYRQLLLAIVRGTQNVYEIYFALLITVTFSYYSVTATEESNSTKWIIQSTIGSCVCTLISLKSFNETFFFISKYIAKMCSSFVKGLSAFEEEQMINSRYLIGVLLVTYDMCFFELDSLTHGEFIINRVWILTAFLVQDCLIKVDQISAEPEIIQGTLFQAVRVVFIESLLTVFPLYIAFEFTRTYSLTNLAIFLTSSFYVSIGVRAVTSMFVFILNKYEFIRQEFWDNFDDIVFRTRLVGFVAIIVLNILTVCFGIVTLLRSFCTHLNIGVFTKYDVLQLIGIASLDIYHAIMAIWRVYIQRKQIFQFTARLENASEDQIKLNNDVCSICFQNMDSAKVTPCNHIFHETCIMKWFLKSQVKCPKCNRVVIRNLP
ncbi:RING finger protein 145-like [Mytilus californianus]|uniref:RING finger protein 145-like n=1 Tax=Mytilus californianus TaxID=6549 RepID=UPI0022452862|nr:RING finger protein 145-like [Mytilus californianus]